VQNIKAFADAVQKARPRRQGHLYQPGRGLLDHGAGVKVEPGSLFGAAGPGAVVAEEGGAQPAAVRAGTPIRSLLRRQISRQVFQNERASPARAAFRSVISSIVSLQFASLRPLMTTISSRGSFTRARDELPVGAVSSVACALKRPPKATKMAPATPINTRPFDRQSSVISFAAAAPISTRVDLPDPENNRFPLGKHCYDG